MDNINRVISEKWVRKGIKRTKVRGYKILSYELGHAMGKTPVPCYKYSAEGKVFVPTSKGRPVSIKTALAIMKEAWKARTSFTDLEIDPETGYLWFTKTYESDYLALAGVFSISR